MLSVVSNVSRALILTALLSCIAARDASASCAPPRPAPGGNTVWVEDLILPSFDATTAAITVRLSAATAIAGTQNDLSLFPSARIHSKANGRPDCTVNPSIEKPGASFIFRPNGCVGSGCTSVRALVFAADNLTPIADGSVLYTCNLDAPVLDGEVLVSGVVLGTPAGDRAPDAGGRSGLICIDVPDAPPTPSPSNVPTSTPTATQTATATHTATATPSPSATPTSTSTSTATPTTSPTASPTAAAPICAGDCNRDRDVTIDELILAVNIGLDNIAVGQCTAADRDGDQTVTIDELISAVGRALDGC